MGNLLIEYYVFYLLFFYLFVRSPLTPLSLLCQVEGFRSVVLVYPLERATDVSCGWYKIVVL